MPRTTPMKSQCEANLGTWKQLAEERKKQKEKAEEEKAEAEEKEKKAAENNETASEDDVRYELVLRYTLNCLCIL